MLSGRKLNNPKRKPNADGLVTYYYTSVEEPLGGRYYRKSDYYVIPVEFELAWKKFIYSHKMPKDIDVILETFNYLIGERMLEELLIYFYSFREYYRYAYRLLYLYEYNPEIDVLGLINDLPLIFRKIFYYQKLDEQADVFIWLYYHLVTEMERRKKITPEPNQAVYERLIAEQEKTAKRVKMTSEQFMEERFIPKVAHILKKRNEDFIEANNVFVFDEDAGIEAELKKLFKKSD